MCAGAAVSYCCRVSVYTPPSSLPKKPCTHRCAHLKSVLYPHRSHPAGWRHYGGRQSGPAAALRQENMGSTGNPGGVWATAPCRAESRRQLGFCKQLWCPLYNLFTGALGRSGQEASGTHCAERICLLCWFPCPGKALQAGTCTPLYCYLPGPHCFPGFARHGMPGRILGLRGPRRSFQCPS